MLRSTLLALALLASPALAAESPAPPKGQPAAPGGAKGKARPKPEASGPRGQLLLAKRALRTAVQLCEAPGRCDPSSKREDEYLTMLRSAEKDFMAACEQCASTERCETERDRMTKGERSPGAKPCD